MSEHAYDEFNFAGGRPRAPRAAGNTSLAGAGYFDRDDLVRYRELDFGPLRVRVPAETRLRMSNEDGPESDAVFLLLPPGQVRLSVLAVPRNGSLWPDLAEEIATSQAAAGSRVHSHWGHWGRELQIAINGEQNWVIGVDGPRWMLLGRATWPIDSAAGLTETMREIIRGCEVLRGDEPMPVRTALMLTRPQEREVRVDEVPEQPAQYVPGVRLVESAVPDAPVPAVALAPADGDTGRPEARSTRDANTDLAAVSGSETHRQRSRTGPLVGAATLVALGGAGLAFFVQDDPAPAVSPADVALPAPADPRPADPRPAEVLPPDPLPATTLPDAWSMPTVVPPGAGPTAPVVGPASPAGSARRPSGPRAPATANGNLAAANDAQRTSDETPKSGGGEREKSRDTSERGDGDKSERRESSLGLLDELSDNLGQAVTGLG